MTRDKRVKEEENPTYLGDWQRGKERIQVDVLEQMAEVITQTENWKEYITYGFPPTSTTSQILHGGNSIISRGIDLRESRWVTRNSRKLWSRQVILHSALLVSLQKRGTMAPGTEDCLTKRCNLAEAGLQFTYVHELSPRSCSSFPWASLPCVCVVTLTI